MSTGPVYRRVHKALHRPLTICGVDRRLFFLALLMGAATFNLVTTKVGTLSLRREFNVPEAAPASTERTKEELFATA